MGQLGGGETRYRLSICRPACETSTPAWPACRIAYERTAFVGAGGALRLTLDRCVRGMLADDWNLAPVEPSVPLMAGRVILEFKCATALPVMFKKRAADLRLAPVRVSKYRLCRVAWGAAVGEAARA